MSMDESRLFVKEANQQTEELNKLYDEKYKELLNRKYMIEHIFLPYDVIPKIDIRLIIGSTVLILSGICYLGIAIADFIWEEIIQGIIGLFFGFGSIIPAIWLLADDSRDRRYNKKRKAELRKELIELQKIPTREQFIAQHLNKQSDQHIDENQSGEESFITYKID